MFTTLAVRDNLALAVPAHLERLSTSVRELYQASLPGDLAERIELAADTHPGPGRMRITYLPGDAEPATIVVKPHRPSGRPATLAPVTVPGGIGAHKFVDRQLLDELTEHTAPALPLLVDLDGQVLESWGANVFARSPDGALISPPLDGRILPGTARARLLQVHTNAREDRLALTDLRTAEEIYLTSALGVQVAEMAPEPTSASTSTPSPTR